MECFKMITLIHTGLHDQRVVGETPESIYIKGLIDTYSMEPPDLYYFEATKMTSQA